MTVKPFLQGLLADIVKTRKHKEDFLFEIFIKHTGSPMPLTIDSLDVDYAVFRPFIQKEVRHDHKGRFDHPVAVAYSDIAFVRYIGEQK